MITVTRSYKLKCYETRSKKEGTKYTLSRYSVFYNKYLPHFLFGGKNTSTVGMGWLANKAQHKAKGQAKAILASSKATGNKWNVPQDPKVSIPVQLEKSNNSFDYWINVSQQWPGEKPHKIPAKSHKALNKALKNNWELSDWAELYIDEKGEMYLRVFVSKEVEEAKWTTNTLGVDVGIKHAVVTSEGYLANGLTQAKKKTRKRLANQMRDADLKKKKRDIRKKEKTYIKQKLDIEAKKIIGRAKLLGLTLVLEDPVIIGNISRGKNQGWAGAYFSRRCAVLAREESVPVFFVNPQYTSQTCSKCHQKDKRNRATQAVFKCVSCGHTSNADLNASVVIAQKGTESINYLMQSGSGKKSLS